MDGFNAESLLNIYSQADLFVIIFVRMIGFFILLPIFSGQNIPAMSKLIFIAAITVIVSLTGVAILPDYEPTVAGYVYIILQEFLVGFIVGFVIYLLFSMFLFAGQLIDFQIGFSMVSVFDPVSQVQVPITGNFYYLVMTMFFVISGSLHNVIFQLCLSYNTIPIGGAFIFENDRLMDYIIKSIISMFEMGVKISLPIVGTILIVDIVLGILVKAVPQMNVFVVGMPLKVFVGLIILFYIIPYFGEIYVLVFESIMKFVANIIRGMTPQ